MLRCGPVLDGEPPGWPMAETIRDAAEARATVRRLAAEGVDCIKVYNEVGRAAFEAVAAAAREAGIPLVGHVPHAVGLEHVADFEAQHLTGVPYLAHPRPPVGMDIRSDDLLAMTDAQIEEALDTAVAGRVAFTPTLANFALRLTASDPARFPPTPAARFLPPWWGPAWNLVAGHPEGEAAIGRQLRALATLRDLVARARDHGIDVLAGTDTLMPWVVPGESLWLELEALARAFGDPEAALAAATTVNGRHLAPGEIGVVAVGARADLLVLSADPTRDLAALRTWRIVVAGGRRYDRAPLEASLERHRAYLHAAGPSRVMGLVVGLVAGRYRSADGVRAHDVAERGGR
jgi:cytosine/adenosine deaminase-related metal-dependent hydrolase